MYGAAIAGGTLPSSLKHAKGLGRSESSRPAMGLASEPANRPIATRARRAPSPAYPRPRHRSVASIRRLTLSDRLLCLLTAAILRQKRTGRPSGLAGGGHRGPAGETGPRGGKGERGARGQDATQIIAWTLDSVHYRAIPTMSDGRAGAPLGLRDSVPTIFVRRSAIGHARLVD